MSLTDDPVYKQLHIENSDIAPSEEKLRWFIYSTHISLRYKFIFVETPKAACSTMKLTLQRLEVGDPNWQRWGFHLHDRQFSPLLTPLQVPSFASLRISSKIKKFGVIRCPYARLLSAYLDKICRNQPQKLAIVRLLNLSSANQYVSFDDFVQAVSSQDPDEMDAHWRPQTRLLNYNTFSYDLLLRAECLDRDIARLAQLLRCDLAPFYTRMELGRTDASTKLSEYYSKPLIETVARIYADDLRLVSQIA